MHFLNVLKERIPDYAKDIRLNLDATIARSSLDPADERYPQKVMDALEEYAIEASISTIFGP